MTLTWWLLVAAALAVVGVIAELAARAWLRRSGYYVWPRYFRREMPVDPATSKYLEPWVRFWVNSDGERGDEAPPDEGTFRVLMVGGSMVESTSNDHPTTWCALVSERLNHSEALSHLRARRVHVGNIGKSGLDSRAVDLVLDRILLRYRRIDAIGLAVGAGDVLRWLEAGAPADRLPAALSTETVFSESPEQRFTFSPRRLALRELVRRLRSRWMRPTERRQKAPGWIIRARAMRRDAERFIDEVPSAGHMLDAFEASLDSATAKAKAKARTVILIRQPALRKSAFAPEEERLFWNGGIGNAHQGDDVKVFFSTRVMYALMDEVDARMRRVAARHGVAYVDPQTALTMDATRFFDHFHLTPAGAAEVAGPIAAGILEHAGRRS